MPFDIPQNALLTLGTPDDRSRTTVASTRYIFSGLAALCVAGALPALLQSGSLGDRGGRYFLVALAFPATAGAGVVLVLAFAYGAASGGIGMAIWSAFANAVARDAARREGWAYGLFTASAKASLGTGGLLIGATLSWIDYRGDDGAWLTTAMTAPSILAGAICIAILWRLPLRLARRNRSEGSTEEGRA